MAVPLAGVLAGTPLKAAITSGTAGLSLGSIGADLPIVGGLFGGSGDETLPDEYVLLAAAAVAIVLVVLMSKQ
ncbi:hypothetical protein OB905_11765 [Halobacteria archaeon AArc-dxtr1]|nr:hypothetical protein [Halobacteria archaeon AArc-dxtr1]